MAGAGGKVTVCVRMDCRMIVVPVAYPQTLSGNLWSQPPMEVTAGALITPRKPLCVQTQFAVTQLWP